jgi:glycosyltransferase involved in cell wall biosynthesis/GT2 family glycosyltransferase
MDRLPNTPLTASVIVVTLDRPDCLERCLRCLAEQTHAPEQIILVDGSGDDRSRKIVEGYPNVMYLRNERGYGHMTLSRNIGLRQSTGDIICFIDDDSYAEPQWLENILLAYDDPAIGAVGGRALNNQPNEGDIPVEEIGRLRPNGFIAANFGGDPGRIIPVDHIIGCNMSFRRDVLAELGGLRDDYPGTEVGEDTDISIRVAKLGYRIVFNPKAAVLHVGAPQAKGKRFNARYEFYHRRNNFVMLLRNYGAGLKIIRYFFATSVMAFKTFVRLIGAAIVRLGAHFGGAVVGAYVGVRVLIKQGRDPIRRDEQGREMTEILSRPRLAGCPAGSSPDTVVPENGSPPRAGASGGQPRAAVSSSRVRPVVLVNNTSETFTPTHSGAIATWIWEVCRVAKDEGHNPLVIARNDPDHAPYAWGNKILVDYPRLPKTSLETYVFRMQKKLNGWRNIRQKAFARRMGDAVQNSGNAASVLVLHNDPEMAVYFQRRFPRATILHHFHNQEECKPLHRAEFTERARTGQIRTSSVSQCTARWIENYYGLRPHSVSVIINGVDSQTFSPAAEPPPGPPVINFCGRTGIEKACDLVLKAALRVTEKTNQFSVQILGANHWGWRTMDPYQVELDTLVAEVQKKGVCVHRPGHVPRADVPASLRQAHIHVIPSRWAEPCALTIFEGLATGLAVVASRTGGTPEVLGDAGFLFTSDNVEELAGHLLRLIEDPQLRTEMGRRARERALQFTWNRVWGLVSRLPAIDAEPVEASAARQAVAV